MPDSPFDLFAPDGDGLIWFATAANVAEAVEKVARKAAFLPGKYLIVNNATGERTVVEASRAAQA